ncbi:hypothetical protein [Sedimenticola hydrogenitrophicus]|uniref:hypothetical protein n=1 Tax=Sedimenticola hydrogenitrophicus TaxID=2967975 RepID=UPI0021A91867|nr:hypothetical protein [Sedimenticola hydrogenitrophicus]
MSNQPENGTRRIIADKECVFYDGYWIRYYPTPENTLANRKKLIDDLTRRAFHHTESGINTPGERLEEAREAYEREHDPARKRVNGAMLAGALFNRASDIFNAIVDLEAKGVKVNPDNELMVRCGNYFKEALELGKLVKHYSGHEGIDELWGEPFKAFSHPLDQLFESRYRKIAQSMKAIDHITTHMVNSFTDDGIFGAAVPYIRNYCRAAKQQIELIKQDKALFTVWPEFVAAREMVEQFFSTLPTPAPTGTQQHIDQGVKLITAGTQLITYLSGARVPMPKSTSEFLEQCQFYDLSRSAKQ